MEGDYRRCGDCNAYLGFQSTPSAWRETYVSSDAFAASHISIHSLRMEGDRPHPRWTQFRSHFNPLPPHGGRHWIDGFFDKFAKISIHSLRMEGDAYSTMLFSTIKSFQSTPSAWRETLLVFLHILIHREFQSTPSAWRETTIATTQGTIDRDFNPLPPHGGRHCHACGLWLQRFYFNPLPPHGGRPWRNTANDRYQHFNPLPPHGGRRYNIYSCSIVLIISIHSLRMEGDYI